MIWYYNNDDEEEDEDGNERGRDEQEKNYFEKLAIAPSCQKFSLMLCS